jgi:hypothetical protein
MVCAAPLLLSAPPPSAGRQAALAPLFLVAFARSLPVRAGEEKWEMRWEGWEGRGSGRGSGRRSGGGRGGGRGGEVGEEGRREEK